MAVNVRTAYLRYAKYYCEQAKRHKANGNRELIELDGGNILRGAEVAEENKDYAMLVDYVKSVGDVWANSEWNQYKRFVYLVLENGNHDPLEKIKYLTNLAMIEEAQGNYDLAKKLLENKFSLLSLPVVKLVSDNSDLFEVAMQIVDLAKREDNFDNLESILLQAFEDAVRQYDVKKQVDILLELALLPEIKNDYERSSEYITRGFNLADKIGYKIGAIDVLIARATIYIFHNKVIEAKSTYKDAWDLAVSVNNKQRIIEIKKQQELLGEIMNKKVFISYNHADRDFVKKLANNLRDAGLSIWWDEWEIKVGNSIIEKVVSGIETSASLVIVLSPSSINSRFVQREVNSALMKQLTSEKDITIFPVLLKDCDIPLFLKEIKWADFRKSYKSGLTELLNALR